MEIGITAETTTAKDENSKEVCKYSVTNKDTTRVKATETDSKLCNINSEDLQLINKSSEEAQNDSTTVEPTSEPCFDSKENSADEKSSKKAIQPIVAGVVGAILLASGVALYIMKMPVVAAVVGIVGLACISFALYHALKPNTKFEKVESVNPTTTDLTVQL
ncbi:hypothetical protein [Wolbachia endosymbiont of Oedothorax gibbosus]|uniref:hypothetical protein n=1 Tax=Wolbachia endosymbiont of Oedothorax gibbosus TaxID=931100 RepID=UPI0020254118|nr:hypothetical protein [Wolbachia endosymbiont of Oedothorax gibbosus]